MTRWFRHYVGCARDVKLVGIAARSKQPIERVSFVWCCILEDAAERQGRGDYKIDTDELAYFLRCDPAEIELIVSEMTAVGMIAGGVVCKWGDRQYQTDTSTERVRKHRAKRYSNVSETPPEAEAESETEAAAATRIRVGEESGGLLASLCAAIGRSATDLPPPMANLAPIEALLSAGFDLNTDVLPVLREKAGKGTARTAGSWAYFVEAIRERRRQGLVVVAAAEQAPNLPAQTWVHRDDALWPSLADRFVREKRAADPLTAGRGPPTDRRGGWHFPTSWIDGGSTPALAPAKPSEARAAPTASETARARPRGRRVRSRGA